MAMENGPFEDGPCPIKNGNISASHVSLLEGMFLRNHSTSFDHYNSSLPASATIFVAWSRSR